MMPATRFLSLEPLPIFDEALVLITICLISIKENLSALSTAVQRINP